MSDGALAGLKVLEYGDFVSAPYCGKLLADAGADVIKVEKTGRRRINPGNTGRSRRTSPHPEKSGLFCI